MIHRKPIDILHGTSKIHILYPLCFFELFKIFLYFIILVAFIILFELFIFLLLLLILEVLVLQRNLYDFSIRLILRFLQLVYLETFNQIAGQWPLWVVSLQEAVWGPTHQVNLEAEEGLALPRANLSQLRRTYENRLGATWVLPEAKLALPEHHLRIVLFLKLLWDDI